MKKRQKRKESDDEVSRLEKEARELKATIRSLEKQLKKLSRGGNKNSSRNVSKSELYEEPEIPKCPECGKGEIITSVVANRKLQRCSECNYRTKAIKL